MSNGNQAILQLAPLATSIITATEAAKPLVKDKKIEVDDLIGVPIKTIIGAEFVKIQSNIIKGI